MKVINYKTNTVPPSATYIGRGSGLGNPEAIGPSGSRDDVLGTYRAYLNKAIDDQDPIIMLKLFQINEDSILSCACKPLPCHGDIIEEVWRSRIQTLVQPRSLTYAGIGSRLAPDKALKCMKKIAERMSELGFTLHSGGANGADAAFQSGSTRSIIYLPWTEFNGAQESLKHQIMNQPSSEAIRLAEHLHANWKSLGPAAKKLIARNGHQVLGTNLRSPVDCVICWTSDGAETAQQRSQATGGTGQAIELANWFRIPVFNLKKPDAMARLSAWITSHPHYQEPHAQHGPS